MAAIEWGRWAGPIAVGAACGVLGWVLGAGTRPSVASGHEANAVQAAPSASSARWPSRSVIQLAGNGNVTLHVEHQPLRWVLEELHRAGGPAPSAVAMAAPVVAPAAPVRLAEAVTPPMPATAATVAPSEAALGRLLRGAEPDRYDALLHAQSSGGLPESVVKTLYETDASPRVRLLAFEASLEADAGDPAALRVALEAAQALPDAVIAQDAARRLAALPPSRGMPDGQQLAAQQRP